MHTLLEMGLHGKEINPVKFRIWNPKTKEMIYPGEQTVHPIPVGFIDMNGQIGLLRWDGERDNVEYDEELVVMVQLYSVSFNMDESISRKEMYEGDIVEITCSTSDTGIPYSPRNEWNRVGFIDYMPGSAMWVIRINDHEWYSEFSSNPAATAKVIGNIYENPDLIDN